MKQSDMLWCSQDFFKNEKEKRGKKVMGGAPVTANEHLAFCPTYKGRVCCDSKKDSQLQMQYEAMDIKDPDSASAIKSILCAACDQFSANLFTVESKIRSVPVLCNSPGSPDSPLSKQSETSFCTNVWDTCQNVSMRNSPFAPSLQGACGLPQITSSKLSDLWQSKSDFCTAFDGRPDDSTQCFNGNPILLNSTQTSVPPKGLCLERLGDKGYINMAAHPDGSDRAFFSDLPGKIWLTTIPSHVASLCLNHSTLSPCKWDKMPDVHLQSQEKKKKVKWKGGKMRKES
nr:HIPL1 protein-like [Tanacetum cinerariifolium]